MQSKAQNYRDLVVWQKGIELAKLLYPLSAQFIGGKIWTSQSNPPRGHLNSVEHRGGPGAAHYG